MCVTVQEWNVARSEEQGLTRSFYKLVDLNTKLSRIPILNSVYLQWPGFTVENIKCFGK